MKLSRVKQILLPSKEEIKEKIQTIQDYLQSNPGVNDVYALQEWLADFRWMSLEMVSIYGQLKTNHAIFSVELLTATSDEDYKKFCKTEALTEIYIAAHFPYMEELNILKPMVEKYWPQVSSEYNTLISASKKQQ
jgi:hypothetical protein